MEGQEYTYVNGHDDYDGNILLDPDGYVTRAELYDAMAEASRPVEVTLEPAVLDQVAVGVTFCEVTLVLALMIWAIVRAMRQGGGSPNA